MNEPLEIIHQDCEGWWFWIETWADRYGPYKSREAAETEFDRYCTEVLD
jgi:hypothetical protein